MIMEKTTGQTLENYKIEPFTLIHDILVNWWVILLGALAAAMLTNVVMSIRYVPQYTTSTTFVVSARNTSASYSSLGTANSMATSFQKVVESSAMQDILCEKLGVDEISADIRVDIAGETNLLELKVTDDSPQNSFDIMELLRYYGGDPGQLFERYPLYGRGYRPEYTGTAEYPVRPG